jgi:peptide/nickel transport system substrate-binding protein
VEHLSQPFGRRRFLIASGGGLVSLVVAACASDSASAPPTTAAATTTAPATTAPATTAAPGTTAAAGTTAAPGTTSGATTTLAATTTATPKLVGPPGPGDVNGGKYGGTVTVAWNAAANSYDPTLGFDGHAWAVITGLLSVTPLAYEGQDGPPAPAGFAEVPTSTDGLTWTCKLNPDLLFHNGRKVVAQDYKDTWTRVVTPDVGSWAASYLSNIAGAADVIGAKSKDLTGVKVVDDHTLTITLLAPSVLFLDLLCQPYMAALPKEEIDKAGKDFATKVVGTGPYMLASYDDAGQKAVFKKFADWPYKGLPYIEEIHFTWGVTADNQLLQLKSGDIDLIGEGITGPIAAQALNDAELKSDLTPFKLPANMWLAIRQTKPELKDVRVRQALNKAIDRKQLATTAPGISDPWGLPLPDALVEYTRTATPYDYDPDGAKQLLAAAGVKNLELNFVTNGDPKVGEILQQQLKDVGIKLNIQTVSTGAFYQQIYTDAVDLFPFPWAMVQRSALDIINSVWISSGGLNVTGYKNADVDQLAAKALAQTDLKESNVTIAELEKVLTEDAAGVFVFSLSFLAAVGPKVKNWNYRAETTAQYNRMWVDG